MRSGIGPHSPGNPVGDQCVHEIFHDSAPILVVIGSAELADIAAAIVLLQPCQERLDPIGADGRISARLGVSLGIPAAPHKVEILMGFVDNLAGGIGERESCIVGGPPFGRRPVIALDINNRIHVDSPDGINRGLSAVRPIVDVVDHVVRLVHQIVPAQTRTPMKGRRDPAPHIRERAGGHLGRADRVARGVVAGVVGIAAVVMHVDNDLHVPRSRHMENVRKCRQVRGI